MEAPPPNKQFLLAPHVGRGPSGHPLCGHAACLEQASRPPAAVRNFASSAWKRAVWNKDARYGVAFIAP